MVGRGRPILPRCRVEHIPGYPFHKAVITRV